MLPSLRGLSCNKKNAAHVHTWTVLGDRDAVDVVTLIATAAMAPKRHIVFMRGGIDGRPLDSATDNDERGASLSDILPPLLRRMPYPGDVDYRDDLRESPDVTVVVAWTGDEATGVARDLAWCLRTHVALPPYRASDVVVRHVDPVAGEPVPVHEGSGYPYVRVRIAARPSVRWFGRLEEVVRSALTQTNGQPWRPNASLGPPVAKPPWNGSEPIPGAPPNAHSSMPNYEEALSVNRGYNRYRDNGFGSTMCMVVEFAEDGLELFARADRDAKTAVTEARRLREESLAGRPPAPPLYEQYGFRGAPHPGYAPYSPDDYPQPIGLEALF